MERREINDKYAIFCLAGKAAQLEYTGVANDEDAKADYSFVSVGFLTMNGVSVDWKSRQERWSGSSRRARLD